MSVGRTLESENSSKVTICDVTHQNLSSTATPTATAPPSIKDLEKYGDEEIIYVDFHDGDPRNPHNFSKRRKWIITLTAVAAAGLGATTVSTFSIGVPSMVKDLGCSHFQALLALGVFPLGFAVVPLVTAPISEDFGRKPLYVYSAVGFGAMMVLAGLAKNIETVIVARFFQGAFASPGTTMVGGTIVDLWLPHERGPSMAIFSVIGVGLTGIGPLYGGWIAMDPRLGWRWCQWIQLILCGLYFASLILGMCETRASVLLTRIAKKMREETGDPRYRSRAEDEKGSMLNKIYLSCVRPLRLLCTEPVVISMTLWIGLAWGIVFCIVASISSVFQTLHGFNVGQTGSVYVTLFIGTLLGFATNLYQEKLYHRYYAKRGPEARLHTACFAAFLVPIGMLIYAWTSYSNVHWIAQAIGLVVFMWGTFIVYLASFSYIADCYGIYASSALAAQGLFRNITATVFPLFTDQMFNTLGYKWGNTLFALLAVAMIPIPFALYFYGPAIRSKSKFSRMVMESQS